MNTIETLPICVSYQGADYTISMYVNAWGNLVIGYRSILKIKGERPMILVYCVEPKNEPYIPQIFAPGEHTWLNEHIGNCKTLDECVEHIHNAIANAFENGELVISNTL